MVIAPSDRIGTPRVPPLRPNMHFDFINFINANFAVEVIWKPVPPGNTFIHGLIDTVVSSLLGLVPGIGPLLSAGFSAAWMAITDPEGFKDWAENGGWLNSVIGVMIDSSGSLRRYVDPGFLDNDNRLPPSRLRLKNDKGEGEGEGERERVESESPAESSTEPPVRTTIEPTNLENVGPSSILLDGLRILAYSETSSTPAEQDGELHSEVLRRSVGCGTMSSAEAFAIQRGLEALPEDDPEHEDPDDDAPEGDEPEGS